MFQHTLTIGRVASIPIRLHWSWLVVFGLLVLTMRPVYDLYACGGTAPCLASVSLATAMTLLLGLSVLLHELGHALVAARLRVPVHSITLFAFGGVAELEADSPSPAVELAIAIAGPAVSLLIALGAGTFWWAQGGLTAVTPIAVLAAHLTTVNMVMAIFNLLPGYPMDGGRVLRATLWFLEDDPLPATRAAAKVGRYCGWGLAVGGLALALATRQPLIALWAALIGAFLHRTASSSQRQIQIQLALRGVSVGDLMQRQLRTITRDLTIEQFVARFVLGQSELGFAVAEQSQPEADYHLLGMLTVSDLRRFSTSQWAISQVGEVMTPRHHVTTLTPTTAVLDALIALKTAPAGLLPVTEGERLVGILRRHDVVVFVQVQLARTNAKLQKN